MLIRLCGMRPPEKCNAEKIEISQIKKSGASGGEDTAHLNGLLREEVQQPIRLALDPREEERSAPRCQSLWEEKELTSFSKCRLGEMPRRSNRKCCNAAMRVAHAPETA
jgi:hypothetical protein